MNYFLYLSHERWPKLILRTKMHICVLNQLNTFHSSTRNYLYFFINLLGLFGGGLCFVWLVFFFLVFLKYFLQFLDFGLLDKDGFVALVL